MTENLPWFVNPHHVYLPCFIWPSPRGQMSSTPHHMEQQVIQVTQRRCSSLQPETVTDWHTLLPPAGPNPDLCGWKASFDHTNPTPPVEAVHRLPIKSSEAAKCASHSELSKARLAAFAGMLPACCFWIMCTFINGVGSTELQWAGTLSSPPASHMMATLAFWIKFLNSCFVFAVWKACFHTISARRDVCVACKTHLTAKRRRFKSFRPAVNNVKQLVPSGFPTSEAEETTVMKHVRNMLPWFLGDMYIHI